MAEIVGAERCWMDSVIQCHNGARIGRAAKEVRCCDHKNSAFPIGDQGTSSAKLSPDENFHRGFSCPLHQGGGEVLRARLSCGKQEERKEEETER